MKNIIKSVRNIDILLSTAELKIMIKQISIKKGECIKYLFYIYLAMTEENAENVFYTCLVAIEEKIVCQLTTLMTEQHDQDNTS